MLNRKSSRDISPAIAHLKDHTIPTYVTRKNLHAFSLKYKNNDFDSSLAPVPTLLKHPESQNSYNSVDSTKKMLSRSINEDEAQEFVQSHRLTRNGNGYTEQRFTLIEKRLQKIEQRLKSTQKFMFASIEYEKKRCQCLSCQFPKKMQISILETKMREMMEIELLKHGLLQKNQLLKCEETIEELKDLLNEEVKLECQQSENTSAESIRQIQHFCEDLVHQSERKMKKFLKAHTQILKKDVALSLFKLHRKLQTSYNPPKKQYFASFFSAHQGKLQNPKDENEPVKYFVDEEGQIMDGEGVYLVNSRGESFHLGKEQIQKLKQCQMFVNML